MSRKTASFRQLLDYINRPASEEKGSRAILHNMETAQGEDLDALTAEFEANAAWLPPRRNGNVLLHEIISFSQGDREFLTEDLIEAFAREYLDRRAPGAKAYARAHFDRQHPHIHFVISANDVASDRRNRLSRAEFQKLKLAMLEYQKEHYPHLRHSIPPWLETQLEQGAEHDLSESSSPGRAESERKQRLRRERREQLSKKELVVKAVHESMTATTSPEAFFLRMKMRGYRVYKRGSGHSVEDLASGKRYRLSTLGLEDDFLQQLERWEEMTRVLKQVEQVATEQNLRPGRKSTVPVLRSSK